MGGLFQCHSVVRIESNVQNWVSVESSVGIYLVLTQCKRQYQFLITNIAVLSVLLPQDGSLHFVNFELLGMW